MTYSSVDSFYVSDGTLSTSPSRKDGVEENTELMLRRFGCDLIQQGGILLRLPQAVMATGQVLLQRFYCKESLAKFDVRKMAPASLWLAMKIEESRRRVRDLVNVFHRMRCRRDNLDVSGLSTARRLGVLRTIVCVQPFASNSKARWWLAELCMLRRDDASLAVLHLCQWMDPALMLMAKRMKSPQLPSQSG